MGFGWRRVMITRHSRQKKVSFGCQLTPPTDSDTSLLGMYVTRLHTGTLYYLALVRYIYYDLRTVSAACTELTAGVSERGETQRRSWSWWTGVQYMGPRAWDGVQQ